MLRRLLRIVYFQLSLGSEGVLAVLGEALLRVLGKILLAVRVLQLICLILELLVRGDCSFDWRLLSRVLLIFGELALLWLLI